MSAIGPERTVASAVGLPKSGRWRLTMLGPGKRVGG